MSPQGVGNTQARATASHAAGVSGSELARARAAAVIVDVQTKRLTLEQRRGALISRERAVLKAFGFARMLRDSWLNWPARYRAAARCGARRRAGRACSSRLRTSCAGTWRS